VNITRVISPNYNVRKRPVDMLVLHYTGMESGQAALARMCDPAAEVSAHYMLSEDGRITRLVDEAGRAWHAGISSWQGESDLNSCSIGIEIVNGGHDVPCTDGSLPPYPDAQIAALIDLCRDILARHAITPARVLGHSDIAPARKTDPGEHFPWARLAAAGIGIWPPEDLNRACPWFGGDAEGLNTLLAKIGYDVTDPVSAVRAFQRRFLPDRVTGFADARTLMRLRDVDAAFAGVGP
jgi:N-acetylmuramoyl-L-alanine amidase